MATLSQLLIYLLAVFTQTLSGFGSGLVAMAFLPALMPMRAAAPITALLTSSIELILLIRLRASFNMKAVRPIIAASCVGVPFGVWGLRGLPEEILLKTLGVVMAGYAAYALLNLRMPELKHPAWAALAGLVAGALSGAFSVGGPPLIIYGNCRRWQPDEFRSNLQGFFLVNDVLVIITHAFSGNLTPIVWRSYLLAVPMILLGILSGTILDRKLNPTLFRRLALGLLLVMGLRMILI